MGASHEMGRDEICVRRSAVSAVVQSVHRSPAAAPPAVDPQPSGRVWVFGLRSSVDWCSSPTLHRLWSQIFLYALFGRDSVRCLHPEAVLLDGATCCCSGLSATQPPLKVCILTLTCWCGPQSFDFVLRGYAEQLEYFLTWAAFLFVHFFLFY